MDIVNRLKRFMNALDIANSQFADTCRIPRPTISQILNGRNKKISDELISKIHDAYPQLSVMWLMFGEGSMLLDSNFKISEPKNNLSESFNVSKISDNEPFMGQLDFDIPVSEQKANNLFKQSNDIVIKNDSESQMFAKAKDDQHVALAINSSRSKRVIEIRVFYSDNSYETFVPQVERL